MENNGLDIPISNREIALHLRAINTRCRNIETTFNDRLDNLEIQVSNLEDCVNQRRSKTQEWLVSSLILPVVGGTVLFLLTKALG